MKPANKHQNESGQILLILTVGIVALLGFLALAVDGGMIYADRRFDQNAADASSFAGAGAAAIELQNRSISSNNFTCSGAFNADQSPNSGHILYHPINNAISAALARAASNNFTIQYPLVDQHGVEIICVSSGDKYLEVRTVISSTVRTAFAHMFYKGEVRNTVEAVARVATAYNIGAGGSLTHLNPSCSDPLRFSGGGSDIINIDGAFTNGCVRKDGSNVTVASPNPVYYVDKCVSYPGSPHDLNADGCPKDPPGDPKFPTLEKEPEIFPKYYLEDETVGINHTAAQIAAYWNPICGTSKGAASFNSAGTLPPGRYSEFSSAGNESVVVTLQSGLYCFDNNFDVGGKTTVQSGTGGVTIIMLNGSFAVKGTATIKLAASQIEGYENLLFYAAKYNDRIFIIFQGTGNSMLIGTIWAPDGFVDSSGNF
jgi:hypothetical protein